MAISKLKHFATQELSALRSLFIAHKLIAIVLMPFFIATWLGISLDQNINETHPLIFWSILIIAGIAQIYFFIPATELRFAGEAYFAAEDALNEAEGLKQEVHRLTSSQANYLAWMIMQRIYAADPNLDKTRFLEAITEFFQPIIDNLGKLFGIMPGEVWTFTLYLHNSLDDQLVPIWREKAKGHPSSGPTRNWDRGVGHVGVTFAKMEPVITPDVSRVNIFRTGKSMRDYDDQIYKSMAAIPIGGNDGHCFGVLVATSDTVDRFDLANAYPLRVLATVIGNVLVGSKIDCATLVK